MSLKITAKQDYILVEPSAGVDYWEILEGISKLFSMPEFKDKNDIWVFREGQVKMLYTDLEKIKDLGEKLYPKDSKGTKAAIVAETGIQQSLMTLFADIGKNLPREIKVFLDLKSAEDWVKK